MGEEPAFFCDAMLGGLARWLRAAGYDALFEYGIDDADLIHRCRNDGRILLSPSSPTLVVSPLFTFKTPQSLHYIVFKSRPSSPAAKEGSAPAAAAESPGGRSDG